MTVFKSPVLFLSIGAALLLARPSIFAGESLTLPAALAEALAQSPALQAIEADIDSAKAAVLTTQTRPAPELTLSPGIRRLRESDGARHEFLGGIALAQTFPFPGKRELLVSLAERNVELRALAIEGLRFQVAAAVRKAFHELLAAQNIVGLRHQQLESAETFRQSAAKRAESGYASDFEAVKSQGDVINARKLLNSAHGRIASARVELNALLGRDPSAPLDVTGETNAPVPDRPLSDWVTQALASNPSLRVQTLQAEIARLNVRKARLARKPDITAGPSLEYSKSEQIIGVSVTIPLAGKNYGRGEILAASAEQRKVQAETEKLRREIVWAVTQAATRLETAHGQLALYTPAYLDQLKAVVEQAERGYAQNATSLLIYLDARRTYFDTLSDYQEAVADVAVSRAELESAVGAPLESASTNSK
ncbi:MAG: TolC family protein [Opitutaceae bacterium]